MLFAAEGAAVLALDRAVEVQATAAAIRAAGGRAIAVIADSSAEQDVAGAVATALEEFGGLDVCYANAGISGGLVPFFEETVERWREVLNINLIGTFLLAKYAAMQMVTQKRGSIICTASVAGLRSGAGGIPYSASKAGVISMVQTMANQLTGTGVRINAVNPGVTVTNLHRRSGMDDAQYAAFLERSKTTHPLGRPGQPDDIVGMILFLASDRASWMTGETIPIDGGRHLTCAR